jgi:hypothetical protein
MTRGQSHRDAVTAAAKRASLTIRERPTASCWELLDDDGRVVWTVVWLRSGYFNGAYRSGLAYFPDHRRHASTSTPRQILDHWISREFPL